ncbi:MAG TPA: cytochrome C [Burkholderiales bacterium]|nr:cytochrome C [Burkholderiales bacterium]
MSRRALPGLLPALVLACLAASPPVRAADSVPVDIGRGRMLYGTSCDACHSQNVHWRDRRIADSWPSLVAQVTRWQANTGRRWPQEDIRNVAAYLNERFYHLPCPVEECLGRQASR